MGDIVSCRPFLLRHPLRTTYDSGSNAITESTAYTIQGWTASKWSDLLRQSWHYENSSLPSWTGNITRWDWSHLAAAGESDSSGDAASYQQRSELFGYDALNRLSGSAMTVGTGASAISDSRWSERNIRYDLDGNLLHLERYQDNANTPQATLDFSYDGPKRVGYAYDSNGNITYDPLRCFEIRYNLLNLASEVIGHNPEESADSTSASADDGAATANETSDGVQLSETVYYADGTRSGVRRPDNGHWFTRYVSSLICDGDAEFLYPWGVVTDFGYIDLQSGKMQYFLRDHLGSVRVIAEDRHTIISRTDYLPFGVRMSGDGLTGGNATSRSSFFGFSGKENEMWDGYDTADGDITPHWLKGERYQHFGARAYDPVSCIFMQVDPMAEKYYGMTPYGYCAGNPVMMVDNLGSQPQSIAYEVVKTFSKKGIQHYLFLSVAPLCAPLSAVLLAGGLVVGDTPITEFSEDDTEGKTTNQDGDDVSGDSTDIEVDFPSSSDEVNSTGGTKIPDSELTPPDKRGQAPKGKDGYPIELHHRGQSQDGPLDEMTRTQHRGVGNFKKNHSNVGTEKSKINRNESNRERREYWKKYWDNGRFGNGNSDGGSH